MAGAMGDSGFANTVPWSEREGLQDGFAVVVKFRIVRCEVSFRDEGSRIREMKG